jgi:hypothetical protein
VAQPLTARVGLSLAVSCDMIQHRDTETTQRAQSKAVFSSLRSICSLCHLCVSVLKRPRATRITVNLLAASFLCTFILTAQAQTPTPSPPVTEISPALDLVTRASVAVCAEREQDPLGSMAIDEMQARPSLPLLQEDVTAGAARAERLLPIARTLTTAALRTLARDAGVPEATLRPALARVAAVRRIKPDMDLRDNASVYYQDPHTIRFGTLFLAGLRTDEAMISVLAHELTHAADGPYTRLASLFRVVATRAARATRTRIAGHRSEELTCDLIGVLVARTYIARTPSVEPFARRSARAVEHNCVTRDETDLAHLSPRHTLHALLALNPVFARELTGEQAATLPRHAPRRARRAAAAHATPHR